MSLGETSLRRHLRAAPSRISRRSAASPPKRVAKAERDRVAEINALARQNRLDRGFSDKHIQAGTSIEEFRAAALRKLADSQVEIDSRPQLHVVHDEQETRREAVTNALMHRVFPGQVELKPEAREWLAGSRDAWHRGEKSGLEFTVKGIIYFRYDVQDRQDRVVHEVSAWPPRRVVGGIDQLNDVNQ